MEQTEAVFGDPALQGAIERFQLGPVGRIGRDCDRELRTHADPPNDIERAALDHCLG